MIRISIRIRGIAVNFSGVVSLRQKRQRGLYSMCGVVINSSDVPLVAFTAGNGLIFGYLGVKDYAFVPRERHLLQKFKPGLTDIGIGIIAYHALFILQYNVHAQHVAACTQYHRRGIMNLKRLLIRRAKSAQKKNRRASKSTGEGHVQVGIWSNDIVPFIVLIIKRAFTGKFVGIG